MLKKLSVIEKLTHTNDIDKTFINDITTKVAIILLEYAAKTSGRYNSTRNKNSSSKNEQRFDQECKTARKNYYR